MSSPHVACKEEGSLNEEEEDVVDEYGQTRLMIASRNGHYEIVEHLLREKHFDPNKQCPEGKTALHYVIEAKKDNNIEIIKALLDYGANIHRKDVHGVKPITEASIRGAKDIVDFFLLSNMYSEEENYNAVELLGATYVDKNEDYVKAKEIWENNTKPKSDYKESLLFNYMDTFDINTNQDLELRALVVRENILGFCHPETTLNVLSRAYTLVENGKTQNAIKLVKYSLLYFKFGKRHGLSDLEPTCYRINTMLIFLINILHLITKTEEGINMLAAEGNIAIACLDLSLDYVKICASFFNRIKNVETLGVSKERTSFYPVYLIFYIAKLQHLFSPKKNHRFKVEVCRLEEMAKRNCLPLAVSHSLSGCLFSGELLPQIFSTDEDCYSFFQDIYAKNNNNIDV